MKFTRDRKAAHQGGITRKNLPASAHGNSADQHIDGAGFASVAATFVIQTCGVLVIASANRFVKKGIKRKLELLVLRQVFNPGQKFLPDHTDHRDATIL